MSKSKTIALIGLIILAFCMCTIGNAVAAEKIAGRNVKHNVKWEQIEVGDEEGHVVAIYENKGVNSRTDGKTFVFWDCGILDINLKTGVGSGNGYGTHTDKDDDKTYYTWEGKDADADADADSDIELSEAGVRESLRSNADSASGSGSD